MELADEQWAVVEPILPKPVQRADGKGRPRVDNRAILNGILWVMRTGARGTTCPIDFHRTKPAIDVSRSGLKRAPLRPFSGNWCKM